MPVIDYPTLRNRKRKLKDYYAKNRKHYRIYIRKKDDYFEVEVGDECFKAETVKEVQDWIEKKINEIEALDWKHVIVWDGVVGRFDTVDEYFTAVGEDGKTVWRKAVGVPRKPGDSVSWHRVRDSRVIDYTEERWDAIQRLRQVATFAHYFLEQIDDSDNDREGFLDAFMQDEIRIETEIIRPTEEASNKVKKLIKKMKKGAEEQARD